MAQTAIKATIVGAGLVGSTIAYTIVAQGVASEIVLVDVDNDRAEGEAMDIEHGSPFFKESLIHAGDYQTSADSDIVIITAGTNQRPGETRMDLIGRNAAIVTGVAKQVKQVSPKAVVLVVSNPVDVMTRVVQEVTGFPAERVIGSGTNLDSARLRYINLANDTRNAAYEIINRKKATYYGIAASASRIAEAILRDEKSIMPLSVKLTGQYGLKDVYLSLPAVIGQHGIIKIIAPYISEEEEGKLHHSAKLLAEAYDSLHSAK